MSVSDITSYTTSSLFQWQNQQLKAASNSGATSSTASAVKNLFDGASMTDQLSSMVELTKYAMDSMGITGNSKVTFSQITKYREQLQSAFNTDVRNGLADVGIKDVTALTFALDGKGSLTVSGSSASDVQAAQTYLNANPSLGAKLREALDADGLDNVITLRLGSSGAFTVLDAAADSVQKTLDSSTKSVDVLRSALKNMGIDLDSDISFLFDDDGSLMLEEDNESAEEVNQWLADNPELSKALAEELKKLDIPTSAVRLTLGADGTVRSIVNNTDLKDIQKTLDGQADIAQSLRNGLQNLSLDKNIKYYIQTNSDGTITIISDHPDQNKVQQFFDANPELVKTFRQIEALAGIDDARKSMQISPHEMKKRLQIENMSAWWTTSSDATSYFGSYSDGEMSLLSGLNMNI